MDNKYDYTGLLGTLSAKQWERIGIDRRAGVAVPLFSIYSSKSTGIGELNDINLLIDWCKKTGMSIIQFLPLNDVGFNFRPYDAQSTFALDPMYLSINDIIGVDLDSFKSDFKKLKNEFPINKKRVDYKIKAAKLQLLWKIFNSGLVPNDSVPKEYIHENSFWLDDYCLFKVIKEKNNELSWEGWGEDLKYKKDETVCSLKEEYRENIQFHKWLQWQLFMQFKKVKQYAYEQNVLLMGDLPFLVSRDSADVWAKQDYFKLNLASGAPPDMLYSNGQRWGMPPYNWENIEKHKHDYLIEKLKYAKNFYDLYRIDHVVGMFRVWTIPLTEPLESEGLHGSFDPRDEALWEEHGHKLLSIMINNSDMLACAEDLGVVPPCSYKILEALGILGIDIQRWMKDWDKTNNFKISDAYRINSVANISTHDMSNFCAWFEYEAGTIDERLFKRKCIEKNISFESIKHLLFDLVTSKHERLRWKNDISDKNILLHILKIDEASASDLIGMHEGTFKEKERFVQFLKINDAIDNVHAQNLVQKALEQIGESASIFSIQLIFDWLSLNLEPDIDYWELRINFPGTLSDKNWTITLPVSLEQMMELHINKTVKQINIKNRRI